jgi:hypothetical protein
MSVSPGEGVSVNHLATAPLSTALDIGDTTVLDIDDTALLWANRVLQVTGTPDSETVETARPQDRVLDSLFPLSPDALDTRFRGLTLVNSDAFKAAQTEAI